MLLLHNFGPSELSPAQAIAPFPLDQNTLIDRSSKHVSHRPSTGQAGSIAEGDGQVAAELRRLVSSVIKHPPFLLLLRQLTTA
jgi:hypothetical protein